MSNPPEVPSSGPAFLEMMQAIDAKLRAEGVDITSRPLLAVREVSLQYGIQLPLSLTEPGRLPPELREYAPLSRAMHQWYKDAYGDRLKVDWCPGRTIVLLDDDLYVMRVPRLMGGVRFVTIREFISYPSVAGQPAICNIIQTIDRLTPAKAAMLSNKALQDAAEAFDRALLAAYTLEATPHDLIQIARGDITAAINALMDKAGRFGESKWASLQAGEKVLKAAIAFAGGAFSHTHDLEKLAGELRRLGILLQAGPLLHALRCSPKIRYGDEPCTRSEALAAHHASLALVNELRDAGAKFTLDIAIRPATAR